MSDTLDLDELERLLAEATPGEWRWWTSNSFRRLSSDATGRDGDVLRGVVYRDGQPGVEVSDSDAALIVALRNAAPALLAMARRAQGVEELREALRYLVWLAETAESHGKLRTFPQATQIIQAGLAALKGG